MSDPKEAQGMKKPREVDCLISREEKDVANSALIAALIAAGAI